MGQVNVKNKDIKIPLRGNMIYNVSKFLRRHDSKQSSQKHLIDNLDTFTQLLDAKVYIDTNSPRYSHIYQGTDTIVKNVMAELTILDPYFAFVKLRRTGSSTSGVKVGLPHESDYVLELPKDKQLISGKSFNKGTLFKLVQDIVATTSNALTDGLPLWLIHGITQHYKIGGVSLVLECRAHANDPASEKFGVTVVLVPVYIKDTTDKSLNKKAKAFLPFSLDQYANEVELYRLLDEIYCDTGFIENLIMKQLPDDTKHSYRVAKFLLLRFRSNNAIPYLYMKPPLNQEMRVKLYGREPWLSSYTLRVLFLHLLLHVHGTEAEQRLKGGLLVFVLLDMIKECGFLKGVSASTELRHPLIDNRKEEQEHSRLLCYYMKPIDDLLHRLEKEDLVKIVDEFNMLNSKWAIPSTFYFSE